MSKSGIFILLVFLGCVNSIVKPKTYLRAWIRYPKVEFSCYSKGNTTFGQNDTFTIKCVWNQQTLKLKSIATGYYTDYNSLNAGKYHPLTECNHTRLDVKTDRVVWRHNPKIAGTYYILRLKLETYGTFYVDDYEAQGTYFVQNIVASFFSCMSI